MKKAINILGRFFLFVFFTVLTQVGGVVYLLVLLTCRRIKRKRELKISLIFVALYGIFTFIIIPFLAPIFGREKVKHSEIIKPANFLTTVLNRNYVKPDLNNLLAGAEDYLNGSGIMIHYLDANFPFIDNFPLLPHLSHSDGKKIDLSLIYETHKGEISTKNKSNSGYGVFEGPRSNEYNQIDKCLGSGYFQYDYSKYLTFGSKNNDLIFSERGTKQLVVAILSEGRLGKIFIEPHLKERLGLRDARIRYHGCRAVRHDDHIHIQLK